MPCTARWPRGVWCRRGGPPPKVARFGLVLGCNHVMPSSSVRQEGTDVDAYHGGPRRRVQPQPVYFRRHNQDSRNQNGPGLHGRRVYARECELLRPVAAHAGLWLPGMLLLAVHKPRRGSRSERSSSRTDVVSKLHCTRKHHAAWAEEGFFGTLSVSPVAFSPLKPERQAHPPH